jgi:hypothetical protein
MHGSITGALPCCRPWHKARARLWRVDCERAYPTRTWAFLVRSTPISLQTSSDHNPDCLTHRASEGPRRWVPRQAIRLAIELDRPMRLWKILLEVMEAPGEGEASHVLDEVTAAWGAEAVAKVMGYLAEWNCNAKHAPVAQVG